MNMNNLVDLLIIAICIFKTVGQPLANQLPRIPEELCSVKPIDVVLLIDSSGSVLKDFENQKNLALSAISAIPVSQEGSHVALVDYSRDATVEYNFTQPQIQAELRGRIEGLKHKGSTTNVVSAFREAYNLLTVQNGTRPNAEKLVLIVTDGHSQNFVPEIAQAVFDLTTRRNATIFAATLSPKPSNFELGLYTTNVQDYQFFADEVGDLQQTLMLHTEARRCTVPTTMQTTSTIAIQSTTQSAIGSTSPGPTAACASDILFLLDGSGSVQEDFHAQKTFIRGVVNRLEVNPRVHRIALIQYAGAIRKRLVMFDFDDLIDKASVLAAVDELRYFGGTTATGKAIEYATNYIKSNRRRNVPVQVIALTDGFSQDPIIAPSDELSRLANVKVFAVGVTRPVNIDGILSITGSNNTVYIGPNVGPLLAGFGDALLTCRADLVDPVTTSTTTLKSTTEHRTIAEDFTITITNPIEPATFALTQPQTTSEGITSQAMTSELTTEEITTPEVTGETSTEVKGETATELTMEVTDSLDLESTTIPLTFRPISGIDVSTQLEETTVESVDIASGCLIDIMFVIDTSNTTRINFNKEFKLAANIVQQLAASKDRPQVSILKLDGPNGTQVHYNVTSLEDEELLKNEIEDSAWSTDSTIIKEAFKMANNKSIGTKNVVIAFDNEFSSHSPKSTQPHFQKNAGIRIRTSEPC